MDLLMGYICGASVLKIEPNRSGLIARIECFKNSSGSLADLMYNLIFKTLV
jgi:hypothetical protein